MEKNMERQLINSPDWRFEKKFLVESHLYAPVLKTFLIDGWYEIFKDRYVNSVYFDDTKFTSYYENLLGISDRTKYRLRFYGKTFKGEGEEWNEEDSTLGTPEPETETETPATN